MLKELQVEVTNSPDVPFLDADRTNTPAWLIRVAYAAHAAAASLAECRDLCEWFGVSRTQAAIHHWYQSYAEQCDQDFIAEPDRVTVDEKQIQLEEEWKVWLYAAIDVDSKVVLHARISRNRGTEPALTFLRELKEEHRVSDAEFLVDGMGYLTALAKTTFSAILTTPSATLLRNCSRPTPCVSVDSTRPGTVVSQAPSAGSLPTPPTTIVSRSHQVLENQMPTEAVEWEGSI